MDSKEPTPFSDARGARRFNPMGTPGKTAPQQPSGFDAILKNTSPRSAFDPGGFGPVAAPINPNRTRAWKNQIQAQVTQLVTPVEVELPSGNTVLAVRPHLLLMYEQGVFPDALSPIIDKAVRMASEGNAGADKYSDDVMEEFRTQASEAFQKYLALLNHVWVHAVIDPVFVLDMNNIPPEALARVQQLPQEDRAIFPASSVSLEDKTFFFMWCQGVDDDIATFRERFAERVETVPQKQVVDNPAIDTDGSESAGG